MCLWGCYNRSTWIGHCHAALKQNISAVFWEDIVSEMGCENMNFSFARIRIWLLSSVLLWCCVYVFGSLHVRAASVTQHSIGKQYSETEKGEAVTGIMLQLDGEVLGYAYDVWQYTHAGGWQFQYANDSGIKYEDQSTKVGTGRYMNLMKPNGTDTRMLLMANLLNVDLAAKDIDGYMIETIRYQKGVEIGRDYEYSNGNPAEWADSAYSLMMGIYRKTSLRLGPCKPEEISYEYRIYSGMRIGEGAGMPVSAADASITKDGIAYWKEKYYMVASLPEAERSGDKYQFELEGWYTEPEGGQKITEGSLLKKGTTLYAHWRQSLASYPVTCMDILKDGEKQQVLGMQTWQAGYGDKVSGASLGENKQPGIYYEGREYTDCSEAIVDTQGATVYRYFKNSLMTVTCVDAVSEGPNAGRTLGTTVWSAPYTEIVSGENFGCEPEVGIYYRGYQFGSSTAQQVGLQGCTVYRYFKPISYDIQFVSNCTGGGIMAPIRNCYYDSEYTLTQNTFVNKYRLDLELNAQDASCDTAYQYVYPEFAGWSDSASGGVLYSDGGVIRNLCETGGAAVLYAMWSEKEITVTAQPKRLGYEFVGWSTDPEDTRGRKQFYIEQDETLYAIWKPAPVTYHVEYYKQNLNQSFSLSAQYEFSAYTESEVSLEELDGIYSGFFLDPGASKLSGIVKPDGSLVLSAYFRRGEYTLRFNENGGTVAHSGGNLSAIKELFEKEITIPDVLLSKPGYEFAGWGIGKDQNQIVARPGESFLMPNHDQTLYAVWIPQDNTSFTIVPYYENISGMGYIQGEKMMLTGITEETVEEGICRFYSTILEQCIQAMFGEGYELVSEKELCQNKIKGDGSTAVEVYLSLKRYTVSFYEDQGNYSSTLITTQGAVHGQNLILPESMEKIEQVDCYQDERGQVYYPGDMVTITGYKAFLVKQKIYYPGETRNPQDSVKPVQPSPSPQAGDAPQESIIPKESIPPVEGEKPTESVLPNESALPPETEEPKESSLPDSSSFPIGTEEPKETDLPIESSLPLGTGEPKETSLPMESALPLGTEQPKETSLPKESEVPDTPETNAGENGQVSVISAWMGATPDPDEIAAVLDKNKGMDLPKKGQKVTRKGIVYRVTNATEGKGTVKAIRLKKQVSHLKIPDAIQIKGYTYKVTAIKKNAFAGKKKLKKITLGKNIRKIGKKAFYENRNLKSISVQSKNMKSIGKAAWKGASPYLKIQFGKDCSIVCKQRVLSIHQKMR